MTTSQRIAATLIALLTFSVGVVPATAADQAEPTEPTCSAEPTTTEADPEDMTDEELLDAAASEQASADSDAAAHERSNDARERQALKKSETSHRHRVEELKTAWRNNDGKKGTERSSEDFDEALSKADPCIPMPEDPRDLPRW